MRSEEATSDLNSGAVVDAAGTKVTASVLNSGAADESARAEMSTSALSSGGADDSAGAACACIAIAAGAAIGAGKFVSPGAAKTAEAGETGTGFSAADSCLLLIELRGSGTLPEASGSRERKGSCA
jgi:hypothetical protein